VRLLVCGGRNYGETAFERNLVDTVLMAFFDQWRVENMLTPLDKAEYVIITGGARGADTLAAAWWWKHFEWIKTHTENGVLIVEPADWHQYGRSAGPLRNLKMLDMHKPTQVVAFPGGTGTADMVKRARDRAVPVFAIRYE
jgi:YspA, cpYpsA-related SLOG family